MIKKQIIIIDTPNISKTCKNTVKIEKFNINNNSYVDEFQHCVVFHYMIIILKSPENYW